MEEINYMFDASEFNKGAETIVERPWKCKHCPNDYRTRCALAKHIDIKHSTLNWRQCERCEMLVHKHKYKSRYAQMHSDKYAASGKCKTCPRKFLTEEELRRHAESCEQRSQKRVECTKCGHMVAPHFMSLHEKRRHCDESKTESENANRRLLGSLENTCERNETRQLQDEEIIEDMKPASTSGRTKLSREHNAPFKEGNGPMATKAGGMCPRCGAQFSYSSNRRRHERKCIGYNPQRIVQKREDCSEQQKSTKRSNDITCSKCGAKFTLNSNRRRHEKKCQVATLKERNAMRRYPTTTEAVPLSRICPKCGMQFTFATNRRRHEKRCKGPKIDSMRQYKTAKLEQNVLDNGKVSMLKCVTCGLPYKNARLLHAHYEKFGHGGAALSVNVDVKLEDDYVQEGASECSDAYYKCTYCEAIFDSADQCNAHETDEH